jgi:hypothetical protein
LLRLTSRWAATEGELPAKTNMAVIKAPRRDLSGRTLTEAKARAMTDKADNLRDHGSMEMIAVWYAHQSDDDNYAAVLSLLTTDAGRCDESGAA